MCCGPGRQGEDVWYDAQEGDDRHTHLFRTASNVARVGYVLYRHDLCCAPESSLLKNKNKRTLYGPSDRFNSGAPRAESSPLLGPGVGGGVEEGAGIGDDDQQHWYLGGFDPQYSPHGPAGPGMPTWQPTDGTGLKVRVGPEYWRNGLKDYSEPSMYTCIGVDLVRSNCKINEVYGRLANPPPPEVEAGDQAAGTIQWTPEVGLPRVILVVAQMPYEVGPKMAMFGPHPAWDYGCSVIATFVIAPETLRECQEVKEGHREESPSLRLLRRFVELGRTDSDGKGGPLGVNKASATSCLFKGIGLAENVDACGVPRVMAPTVRQFNGKPALITKSAKCRQDPMGNGEWMEIDLDVRKWSWLARSMLVNLYEKMVMASVHIGFTIQGCKDDELPERILGSFRLNNPDFLAATYINVPSTEGSSSKVGK